jgi:hypothetical protein
MQGFITAHANHGSTFLTDGRENAGLASSPDSLAQVQRLGRWQRQRFADGSVGLYVYEGCLKCGAAQSRNFDIQAEDE